MQNQTLMIQQEMVTQSFDQKNWPLAVQEMIVQMLPLTAEQLTLYLETVISSNPFIEMVYPKEVKVVHVGEDHQLVQEHAHHHSPQSLHLYLSQQIMDQEPSPMRDAMLALIDQLDKRGYITQSYKTLSEKLDVHEVLMLDALNYFKRLNPAGIGAKDLQEALLIQTMRDENAPTLARYLLDEHFDKIATLSSKELADSIGVEEQEVDESIQYYQTLNPAPASLFHVDHHQHLVTDYSFEVLDDDKGLLTYHGEFYPFIEFNQAYFDEMSQIQGDGELTEFIADQKVHYAQLKQALTLYQELMVAIPGQGVRQLLDLFTKGQPFDGTLDTFAIAETLQLDIKWVEESLYNKNIQVDEAVYSFNDWLPLAEEETQTILPLKAQAIILNVLEEDPNASIETIQAYLKQAAFHLSEVEVALFVTELDL